MVDRHRVDDAQRDIGQGSYGDCMAFAFGALALVVGQRPDSCGRLRGELIQSVAQGLQAGLAFERFGIVATLEGDGSCASESLQTRGIGIACLIRAD